MMVETGQHDPAIAVTKDGVMLAGTSALVRDRLADGWAPPARPPGSSLAYAAEVLSQKPVYALVLTMSQAARAEAVQAMGGKNFLTDLVQRHKLASVSVFHDGIGWTWVDSSRAGLESMAQMSEGLIDLLRAAQIAPRGFAKIALGALDSYRGVDPRLDQVIRRKGDLMKIVEAYTGDGKFDAKVDKDPRALKLTVRATGKSLSEVVPTGFMLPLAALGLVTRGADHDGGPMEMPAAPSPRPQPRTSPGLSGGKRP
jgi:hypothetical protein